MWRFQVIHEDPRHIGADGSSEGWPLACDTHADDVGMGSANKDGTCLSFVGYVAVDWVGDLHMVGMVGSLDSSDLSGLGCFVGWLGLN
jgi:hypothetical protein